MNEIGYDVATIGNHEFDYGIDQLMKIAEKAEFPYICANFADAEGNPVFEAYTVKEVGGWKIGFVGAITPKTFTSSNPKNFKDAEGNYIYNFSEGNDGADLYAAIQTAVDETRRRREIQKRFNEEHGIEPKTIRKAVSDIMQYLSEDEEAQDAGKALLADDLGGMSKPELMRLIASLEESMALAADGMEFEAAARFRDQVVRRWGIFDFVGLDGFRLLGVVGFGFRLGSVVRVSDGDLEAFVLILGLRHYLSPFISKILSSSTLMRVPEAP